MVWNGNILFDIVHNIIEKILTKHNNIEKEYKMSGDNT